MLTKFSENRVVCFFGSDGIAIVFKVVYLLLALLSFNSLIANMPVVTYAAYVVAVFGLLVLAGRVIQYRRFEEMPLLPVLGFFLASFIVSAVLSARYGIMENVQGFIWITLEFCCLYACDIRQSNTSLRRDLSIFAVVFIAYTMIASLVGIYMGLVNYQDGFEVRYMVRNLLGIFQGRLYGLYSDPNYGAVYGLISIAFSWWIFLLRRSGLRGFVAVANTLVQGVYIGLTGSRTGVYGAIFLVFLIAFLFIIRYTKDKQGALGKRSVRVALSIALSCCLSVCVYAGFKGVERVYLALVPTTQQILPFPVENGFFESKIKIYESPETIRQRELAEQKEKAAQIAQNAGLDDDADVDSPSADSNRTKEELATQGIGEDKIGLSARVDVDGNDYSNGRFSIWKSGLEIFLLSPLVGVSHRHIADFAAEYLPATYIVQEGYTTMHNVFVDAMVSQGILGLVPLLIFIVLGIRAIVQGLILCRGDDYYRAVLLVGILASIAFSALFYSEILYINTVGSVVFWTVLGYVMVHFKAAGVNVVSFGSGGRSKDE